MGERLRYVFQVGLTSERLTEDAARAMIEEWLQMEADLGERGGVVQYGVYVAGEAAERERRLMAEIESLRAQIGDAHRTVARLSLERFIARISGAPVTTAGPAGIELADLVKARALIAAEIDRLQRVAAGVLGLNEKH